MISYRFAGSKASAAEWRRQQTGAASRGKPIGAYIMLDVAGVAN